MKFKTQYSDRNQKKTREITWWSTEENVDKETGEVSIKKVLKKQDIDIRYESNNLPSLTIPDQSMSVTDLIKRFQQGLTLTDAKVPLYYGDETEYPDLRRMDIAEKYEYLERTKLTVKELNEKFKAQQRELLAKQKKEQMSSVHAVHHDDQSEESQDRPYENSQSASDRRPGASPAAGGNKKSVNKKSSYDE